MTIRTFLENVIKAEISDEMTAFARERIAKLDEKNEKKKSATSAKKAEQEKNERGRPPLIFILFNFIKPMLYHNKVKQSQRSPTFLR